MHNGSTPKLLTYRTCALCDRLYEAGTYRAHAEVHIPIRKGRTGTPQDDARRTEIQVALASGQSQSAIARHLGISRQRVHQLAHPDALGRDYNADRVARYARRRRESVA